MSITQAVVNLSASAGRRMSGLHKPFVRMMRRRAREAEHQQFADEVSAVDAELARIGKTRGTILAGPWLAEVGYEVLYWIPFLRWFVDAYGIAPQRMVVVSRGGMTDAYADVGATYVDLFDLMSPTELAARNRARQASEEGGGQKQSSEGALDRDLIELATARAGMSVEAVVHPSLLFRLFRNVWHGNLPMDVLQTRTRYRASGPTLPRPFDDLPADYTALKLYAGPALSATTDTRETVRRVVAAAARTTPVVALDTNFGIDEHRDFDVSDIPNVVSFGARLDARTNLGTQLAIIAGARSFLGTCGGLAWMAPFLRVPTVALLDSDRLLGPHLLAMRHARHAAGAAPFATLDVSAIDRVGLVAPNPAPSPGDGVRD
jgi:hypothetical protein